MDRHQRHHMRYLNGLIKFIAAAYGCSAKCTDFTTARITLFNALIKKKADILTGSFRQQHKRCFRICNGLLCRLSSHGSAVLLQLMFPMQRTLGGNERVPCCFQSPCPNATVLTLFTRSQARHTRTIHSSSSDDETSSGTESDSETSADVTTDTDSN